MGNSRTRSLTKPLTDKTHGFAFAEAALLHVEDLLGADLADAGFVLGGVLVAADGDGGVGVGAAVGVDQ